MRYHKKCTFLVILGHAVVFLMYNQECHYCQSDLVVIEFTGRGPRTRKESKSEAKASDFDS